MNQTKFCKICKTNNRPPRCPGFLIGWGTLEECPYDHNTELETYNISGEDLLTICDISEEPAFIESMIALKESNLIEYQLKMSQFKASVAQQESSKAINDNKPKCPTCGSINIKPITATERATSILGLGIFSKKINKTYMCLNCKHTW